jgi:hypothetical protein
MTVRADAALRLLSDRGAASVEHPGGTLLTHLERTRLILADWQATEVVQIAGLCHAAYGTDGFPTPLFGPDERSALVDVIGSEAESIVYLYGACDRTRTYPTITRRPLLFVDRHTGEQTELDDEHAGPLIVLTAANELDVARNAELTAADLRAVTDLLARLSPGLPGRAKAAIDALANP